MASYKYLDKIKSPADIKNLTNDELENLCMEIRARLIETVADKGGHLSSNLGVVELTVGIHKVFSSPVDQFIFDVGHQCYTHKLLTGRGDKFDTLRQKDGISGFPKPSESEHDILIAGHASTSISSACGLAMAKTITGDSGHVIAVIGDGALSGGMSYEGLNNAGRCKDNIIVILNDNKMSISRNVGSMARYLSGIRSKKSYVKMKTDIEKVVSKIPGIGEPLRKLLIKMKQAVKSTLYQSTLFEDMGLVYLGPVDGNDIKQVINILERAKEIKKPVLIHACTVKGKGYTYAEQNPGVFHGISNFNIETGDSKNSGISFSDVFGKELCALASKDKRVCAVTAAMKSGTGLSEFASSFKNRFFDVGIAEQHAVTFSAGLAANGMKPVFAVYSSFLQRGYDQLIHDVAIQKLNVIIAIDRAGVVGEDGETHNGLFDTAFLNSIPNFEVYSPSYFEEMRNELDYLVCDYDGPAAIRYPRGGEQPAPKALDLSFAPYKFIGEKDSDILLVTYGRTFSNVYSAFECIKDKNVKVSLLKLNRIKPIADDAVVMASGFKKIFFFEEGVSAGGIGEHFERLVSDNGFSGRFHLTAADNAFIQQASVKEVLKDLKLDKESIIESVMRGIEND